MELVHNHSFTLTTSNSAQSSDVWKTTSVNNQSWLPSFLTSTSMTSLSQLPGSLFTQTTWPSCTLQKIGSHWRELSHRTWQHYHCTFRNGSWSSVPLRWSLLLSTCTTKRQLVSLRLSVESCIIPFSAQPTYIGTKLDRSLTYRQHLESLHKKLTKRVGLLRHLAGLSWGVGARTLHISTLALIHSAAEYCAPVWSRSAHTWFIDKPINDALRFVTGCLHPTPTNNLYICSIRHHTNWASSKESHTVFWSLACRAQEPGHLLHNKSHLTFMKGINSFKTPLCAYCSGTAQRCKWTGHQCSKMGGPQVEHGVPRKHLSSVFIFSWCGRPSTWNGASQTHLGLAEPSGVGLFQSPMHKWDMASTVSCKCGAEERTADHIITSCPKKFGEGDEISN